jgi:hypothetical protein
MSKHKIDSKEVQGKNHAHARPKTALKDGKIRPALSLYGKAEYGKE